MKEGKISPLAGINLQIIHLALLLLIISSHSALAITLDKFDPFKSEGERDSKKAIEAICNEKIASLEDEKQLSLMEGADKRARDTAAFIRDSQQTCIVSETQAYNMLYAIKDTPEFQRCYTKTKDNNADYNFSSLQGCVDYERNMTKSMEKRTTTGRNTLNQ